MLSKWGQNQGKGGFFQLNFQNSISWNTCKCKLGGFCSDIHKCYFTSAISTKTRYYETFSQEREEKYQKNTMPGPR